MATLIRRPMIPSEVYEKAFKPSSPSFGDRSPFSEPYTPPAPPLGFDRTPLLEKIRGVSRELPAYTPIAPGFVGQAPVPIARPTPEFFKNLFEAKVRPVDKRYFAPGGISDQEITREAQRGFLTGGPSGVALQSFEQTVTDPYVSELADIQKNQNIIEAEMELQLSQFDAQRQDEFRRFSADLQFRDQEAGANREIAQRNIDSTFLTLESNIMNAQSEDDLQRYATEVGLYENMVNQNRMSREFERTYEQNEYQFGVENILKEEESKRNAFIAAGGTIEQILANNELRRLFGIPEGYETPEEEQARRARSATIGGMDVESAKKIPGSYVAGHDSRGNPIYVSKEGSRL